IEIAGKGRNDKENKGIAYDIRGDFGQYMLTAAKELNYRFLFAEFGTYSSIKVLGALREENQAHFFAPRGSRAYLQAKSRLLECFCPKSSAWRASVQEQGVELIYRAQQAAALLSSRAA